MRTGTLRKRGNIWWGRVIIGGLTHEASLETENKSVGRQRLAKWVAELEGNRWGERPRRTIDEAIEKFAADHFRTLKPNSVKRYLISLDHLIDHMTGMPLDGIGSANLLKFENARIKAGAKPPTVRRDLACLSSVFSRAEEWEWIDKNPVKPFLRSRKRHGLKESPPRQRYLSHDEESSTIEHAPFKAARAIKIAIDTGLRKEEQFSLPWRDVDLKTAIITVQGSVSKNGKRRQIPILPRSLDLLHEMRRECATGYVFQTVAHTRYSKTSPTMYEALQKAVRRAGIDEHVGWHDLRRTCGCRLLQDYRMPMHEVSAWLGHSDTRVTADRYAFLRIDNLHAAVSAGPSNVVAMNLRTGDKKGDKG